MSKIQVLHIIKSLGRGGAEMLLPETLKEHDQDRFDFHYIYFLPWKNQLVATIQSAGGEVTCLPAKNNLQLLFQFPKIIAYCKQHDIQLIHAHLPWAGFVSRIVYLFTKIPTIYTEHNLQERYHFITKIINRFSYNFQTLGIGVSEDVTASIRKNIKPKVRVKTVLNGVNTRRFLKNHGLETMGVRSHYGIPQDAFLVGTVAVFRFQKRLDLWLEILAESIAINPNIYGIIIGAGPLESSLKEKQKALGLEGKVFFTGLQSEVKPYYEAMNVFMMSSSFEGLPIALLEAMSMGCAILSTNAGGIKEVLRNNEDGLLVAVEDWNRLTELLVDLSYNSEKLHVFQSQSRKRVVAAFSIEAMVNQLETLYLEQIV